MLAAWLIVLRGIMRLLPIAFLIAVTILPVGARADKPQSLASPLSTKRSLLEPPFVRLWTQRVGDYTSVIAVRGGLVYYRSRFGVGALDLASGALRWQSLPKQQIDAAVIQGNLLYALQQEDKGSVLVAVDITPTAPPAESVIEQRQARIVARLPVNADNLAVDAARLYVLDGGAVLRAYHPTTGAVLWSRALSKKTRVRILSRMVATPSGLWLGIDDVGAFCVEPQSGKVLWNHPDKYASLYPPIVVVGSNHKVSVITQYDRLRRMDLKSGKTLWKATDENSDAVLVGDVLIDSDQKALIGRRVSDGHVLWRLPLRDKDRVYSYGMDDPPVLSDGQSVWLNREPLLCITKEGKEKWVRSNPFTGTAYYADGERLVTVDGQDRILCYRRGTLPPLPPTTLEKQALAERLVAQFELLDDAERQQLPKLSPFALAPLLARYVEEAKAFDAKGMSVPDTLSDYDLYSRLTAMHPLLLKSMRRSNTQDTAAFVSAIKELPEKSSWHSELEGMLQAKGDPSGYIPFLVERLRQLPFAQREESTALDAVSHSSHPEAVALMLEALRDPKAAPAWRKAAFIHLPETGGKEGVEAVQTVRKELLQRRPLKPWYERINMKTIPAEARRGVAKDRQGRTWMLFQNAVLGNYSDLFVVEKRPDGTWGRPLFTGTWTERTFNHPAPRQFRGIPLTRLVATGWIRVFPDDATIRQDSDGDGLTNVVETRLGTDSRKADMDKDGLSDAADPCPNASPRPLTTDTEKIVEACLEARFFEGDWGVPAVLGIPSIKPLELYGYAQPLLWARPGKDSLGAIYGGGVNFISFHNPNMESIEKTFITFSPDRKIAHTVISRYSGGLNGEGTEVTLKKFGNDWLVVDMRMQYIS